MIRTSCGGLTSRRRENNRTWSAVDSPNSLSALAWSTSPSPIACGRSPYIACSTKACSAPSSTSYDPIASLPGEVLPSHEFYSYEAKYIDENGAALEIPAKLPKKIVNNVQALAIKAYKALCCEGMARVDLFLKDDNEIIINEINTIPGFTNISMYPKLWEASGISNTELIDRLIQLAIERYESEKRLETSFKAQ